MSDRVVNSIKRMNEDKEKQAPMVVIHPNVRGAAKGTTNPRRKPGALACLSSNFRIMEAESSGGLCNSRAFGKMFDGIVDLVKRIKAVAESTGVNACLKAFRSVETIQ